MEGDGRERELLGAEISEERIARAADLALADAKPLDHNQYNVPLARSLVRQALRTLTDPLPLRE